jgi:hypothetical protein
MRKRTTTYNSDDDKRAFENYYCCQSGDGMPVFAGARYQRGHGIGSLFSGLFRSIMPLIKKAAPIIGRKALEAGANIIGDVGSGRSFKDSAKQHASNAFSESIKSLFPQFDGQTGSGQRRKRKRIVSTKRTKKDIFA